MKDLLILLAAAALVGCATNDPPLAPAFVECMDKHDDLDRCGRYSNSMVLRYERFDR